MSIKFYRKKKDLIENSWLPRNRACKLLLALYGKPYIPLRSAALDVVCSPDSAPHLFSISSIFINNSIFNCILIVSFYK